MHVHCTLCRRPGCCHNPIYVTTIKLVGAEIMADSHNSTTLPSVTRRKMLTGTAIALGTLSSHAFAGDTLDMEISSDPVLTLWQQWHDAHHQMERLGREQQKLERQLAETVDYPHAMIELSDGERVAAYSLNAIYDVFDDTPNDMAARAKAEVEFAAHQLRWDEADREIGYSATVKAEHEADDHATDLLDVMAVTSSTSLAGVAAKLDAVLREGSVWEDCNEFPWPQIRSVLDDIERLKRTRSNGITT